MVYSGAMTALLLSLIRLLLPLRVDAQQEVDGLDVSFHLERQN